MRGNATALGYALCTLVLCGSLVWQQYPPCVDYPQHLAVASELRDILLGTGSGHLVPWTYNGLFELVAGVAALLLPIDLSGRLVLASGVALTALAVWRVVRFCGGPAAHAFAWFPFAYSVPLSWGFVNFTLSVALATLGLVWWLEKRSAWVFLVLSLLTGMAHVLGACVLVAGVSIGGLLRLRQPASVLLLSPLLAWVGLAHRTTEPPPHLPWANQVLYPQWSQRSRLVETLLGTWLGPADEWLAAAAGAVICIGLVAGAARAWSVRRLPYRQPFFWLTLIALAGYSAAPLAMYGCWFFYQRAGYLLTLWVPAMLPSLPSERWRTAQAAIVVALGALSTVNFAIHNGPRGDAADAGAIIDAIPPGAHVAPVLDLDPGEGIGDVLRGASGSGALVWGHFPAYAVARRGAEITWMFAREHRNFPVRLPAREEPELPPVDYGWSRAFHPAADYARQFRHVLVLAGGTDPARDPRSRVFGAAAANAAQLAHRGRFWLFEYAP